MGEDADEYRRGVRGRLRELVERAAEAQPGGAPEWLVLYVCPLAAGPTSKAAGKVRPPPPGSRDAPGPAACRVWPCRAPARAACA